MRDPTRNLLPESWIEAYISQVAKVNPTVDKSSIPEDLLVSFVPMPAVGAGNGRIDLHEKRPFSELKKGYTPFLHGDVLFAKITPCMENGKMAIVPALTNGLGFGSTEFHVLRPFAGMSAAYLYYFVSSQAFRREGEHNMTGAVGQRRVPTTYLSGHPIPVPPAAEQLRIVAKLEELFSELDKAVESLTTARRQLEVYRKAVLRHAFEGKLTADWRAENSDRLESSQALLTRIREERELRYTEQLKNWEHAITEWRADGEPAPKPRKPLRPLGTEPLLASDTIDLPAIPKIWAYARMGEFIERIEAGHSFKCDEREPDRNEIGVAKVSAVTWGEYDEAESKTCTDEARADPDLFIKPGDFLLSRANTIELVGACVIVRTVTKSVMLSDKTLRLHFDAGNKRFCLYYLRSITGRAEIEKRSTGNQESMRNIGQDRIRSLVAPVCSEEEMAVTVARLEAQLTEITRIDEEVVQSIRQADTLRQAILNFAFSGQLVTQNPNDEPATFLLERIVAAREQGGNSSKKTRKRHTETAA